VKLIAEPWDIGPAAIRWELSAAVCRVERPFSRCRASLLAAANVSLGDFARRFAASSDLFQRNGRQPAAAVNLVTAHDGFTLRDCVCFNQKHNEANGEENRDGTNNNYSNNHGIEGLEGSLAVIERRRASVHALLRRCCWRRARRCCWRVTNMVTASTATTMLTVRTTR
jgi:glycogen operon protein